jgi:hypothetical protein
VQINTTLHDGPAIGLDWFLINLFLMALIYVPLERLAAVSKARNIQE